MLRIAQPGYRRLTDLVEVEAADLTRHADRDAEVCRDEHVRERRGQQARLLHAAVVVIHKVHGAAVDIAEYLRADRRELGLGVTRGGVGHVAGIYLAEVALGLHKRGQQRLIARRETDHRVIYRGVAVRVETHGLADDVRALCARAGQQTHLVHRVQQLPVRGLEAVYLRYCARHDDAHRVGHEVCLQRFGYGLLQHLRMQADDVRVIEFFRFLFLFLSHGGSSSLLDLLAGSQIPAAARAILDGEHAEHDVLAAVGAAAELIDADYRADEYRRRQRHEAELIVRAFGAQQTYHAAHARRDDKADGKLSAVFKRTS